MSRPPPIDTSDLTGTTKILADRLEPRLRAGAETFGNIQKAIQGGKYIAAALVPIVLAACGLAVWSVSLAKKSDVTAQGEIEAARHAELERRTAVLEATSAAQSVANGKALDNVVAHLGHIDDVLLDIRIRLGAVPTPPAKPSRRPRMAPHTGGNKP